MEDFDNLYFWNTLNKTHQGILVWDRNKRLHTNNKKHVYKDRKETTHIECKGVGCASGVGLPPATLSPNFLDKRVRTVPTSA